MKKFSLKFMVIFILSLFSSFIYADGVFSRYINVKFPYGVNVPLEQYEQANYESTEMAELPFVKNSSAIPSKNYFTGYGAVMGDGISIKNKSKDINITVYGTYYPFSYTEDSEEENVRADFKNNNLNYNQFINKYYNGKSPKNFKTLKFNYNKILFEKGDNVAYNTIGKDFYAVSYIEDNKIIYEKVMYNKNEGYYVVFHVAYLPKDKKFMDKIVTEMASSIKFLKYE